MANAAPASESTPRTRVAVLGVRGFPGVAGGVEAHCEQLYPRLVEMGFDVEAFVRAPFLPPDAPREWRGIRLVPLWCPTAQGVEALVHSLLAAARAARSRPDVVHVHNVGPALVLPLLRAARLRVVVTHHSLNYLHEKWNRLGRRLLLAGEAASARYATRRIAVSPEIARVLEKRYGCEVTVIPNGVDISPPAADHDALSAFGLEAGRYVLFVGRIVPEKRVLDLIHAFSIARAPGWKLALVGGSSWPTLHERDVLELAARTPGVVCTGYQSGRCLQQLYSHAGLFALPSAHEGQPLVLLEALGYGLQVVASDIPACRDLHLDDLHYFPVGDVARLADLIRWFAAHPASEDQRAGWIATVSRHHNWKDVVSRTAEVLRDAARHR